MTYLIEGTLLREEKPEKYLNTFVYFQQTHTEHEGQTQRTRDVVVTNSEELAQRLNERGYEFRWNDDHEIAKQMCGRTRVDVRKSMLIAPQEGWLEYANRTLIEDSATKTLRGELRIWDETRLPLPFAYLYSRGDLAESLFFDGERFGHDPDRTFKGTRQFIGMAIQSPFGHVRYGKTESDIVTYRTYRIL